MLFHSPPSIHPFTPPPPPPQLTVNVVAVSKVPVCQTPQSLRLMRNATVGSCVMVPQTLNFSCTPVVTTVVTNSQVVFGLDKQDYFTLDPTKGLLTVARYDLK